MAELTQYEMTTGIVIMIIMILQLGLAVILLAKYFSTKDKRVLYFSLFMTFGTFSFIAISINFINILLTGESIGLFLYLLIAFGIAPLSLVFWMILITELIYKDKRKIILGIFLIYWIAFRIAFFYIFFTDIDSLATNIWVGGLQVGIFLRVVMITQLILILVTSILFFRESHKSENKEVRLKGTLFLLGILVLVGSMLIFSITGNSIFVLIFMIPAILFFYGSLAMPEWVKKNLIKE
jgi:uncharacterized membrane protein YgdD (TMEM256/DUF423 family)